jgi:phosphoglycolate phosphatase-like HAD superfamily hydrolase
LHSGRVIRIFTSAAAARRAKALGVGVLLGGYGDAELIQAGACRLYKHPAD